MQDRHRLVISSAIREGFVADPVLGGTPFRVVVGFRLVMAMLLVLTAAACGAAPSPSPSPSPGLASAPSVRIDLVAANIEFQPAAVAIPAGTDFVVHLDNRDAGVPHNVALLADANFTTTLAKGEIVNGPAVVDLAIAGLIPGSYRLMCEVHPNMVADLTVEP
ncbi:MAG: cupredoxin domain-containing protein [Candidatus Limnocylindrales bacterium]